MKKILFVLFLVTGYLFLTSPALADDEVRNLTFDAKVKGYTQTTWYDNLDSSNIIFAPRDRFEIQLRIKNLGNRNQTNIHVSSVVPASTNLDMADFTINQIVPGQEFTQNLVVTIRDRNYVYRDLKSNTVNFNMKSDVGTQGSDSVSFFTSNGYKGVVATQSANTPTLPKTGASNTLILGSLIATTLGFVGFRLRAFVRGN